MHWFRAASAMNDQTRSRSLPIPFSLPFNNLLDLLNSCSLRWRGFNLVGVPRLSCFMITDIDVHPQAVGGSLQVAFRKSTRSYPGPAGFISSITTWAKGEPLTNSLMRFLPSVSPNHNLTFKLLTFILSSSVLYTMNQVQNRHCALQLTFESTFIQSIWYPVSSPALPRQALFSPRFLHTRTTLLSQVNLFVALFTTSERFTSHLVPRVLSMEGEKPVEHQADQR